MEIKKINKYYSDNRGSITDIVEQKNFNGSTIIVSKKGSIRGNHYHKKTIQHIYILSGKMIAYAKRVNEPLFKKTVLAGDLISHDALEAHAFKALEDTTFIVFSSGLRTGKDYEKDTYRLNVPIEDFSQKDII
tara:strand:- start:345 stop:743 length:399 start_codon:yes stop_codon:yes gene_type:complete